MMILTDFEVINLGFIFLCYRSVYEITLVLPHHYKKFKSYQTGISSFNWPLVENRIVFTCVIQLVQIIVDSHSHCV